MKNLSIRKLRQKDTQAVVKIYQAITQKPDVVNFQRVVEELAQKEINACYVAEKGDQVVGYMVSYMLSASFGVQQSAWIPMVGVDPDFMGQGIGMQLANAVFEFYKSKGIQKIYTSVRWYDADVLSFFKTLGFNRSEFVNLQKQLNE